MAPTVLVGRLLALEASARDSDGLRAGDGQPAAAPGRLALKLRPKATPRDSGPAALGAGEHAAAAGGSLAAPPAELAGAVGSGAPWPPAEKWVRRMLGLESAAVKGAPSSPCAGGRGAPVPTVAAEAWRSPLGSACACGVGAGAVDSALPRGASPGTIASPALLCAAVGTSEALGLPWQASGRPK
jgi:hypothetical protein